MLAVTWAAEVWMMSTAPDLRLASSWSASGMGLKVMLSRYG